ncbi:MAG: efflux RND transporter periplasmic adaptor subunit [Bacteroidetes bacterium]|jgi:membrane fusion protein (multidrug efflux system)|nr:efflux RND transporter periplasmic adaptor subunit [Bacteroidota bacterium]
MKYLLYLITLLALISASSCGSENSWPEDIEGKKTLLTAKKDSLRTIEKDIAKLVSEIAKLEPNKEKPRELVTLQKVEKIDFQHFIEIQGSVQSDEYVNASSEVGGRIIDLRVREGQTINKGALVAKLDLEAVQKQIAELEKSMELAVDVYERQKRLWDQNIGSEIQYLQAKNNKERLEKSLETINYQLTKAEVYAPSSGVVEMVNIKAGEMVSPGMPIITILNTYKVKVVANVPETYIKAIGRGEEVTIKFPALDTEKRARVTRIGNIINPANRTFEVEVEMANPKGLYKPNLLAIMMVNDNTYKDVPTVPIEMVQQEVSGRSFVYIKSEGADGSFAKKVYVKTGDNYDGKIVITEGLIGGEEILVDGARVVAENALIKIQ